MVSIISYAGLDESVLWAGAKQVYSQSANVPARFRMLLPLFPVELVVDMPFVGGSFAREAHSYHKELSDRMPQLYTGDNRLRCFDADGQFIPGKPVTIDAAWTARFPQYQPFVGEKLAIHMIGGGHQAVAVPESLFPRGGALLSQAEETLHITERCKHLSAWIAQQLQNGRPYDADALEEEYIALFDLSPVCIRQKDLGRVMQEMAIVRDVQRETPSGAAMYTEASKLSESIPQYVPFRYACDCFDAAPVTRGTARLLQLHFEGDSLAHDFWLPYEDAGEYIDRRRMTLDVRALCEGFQIAPACDADTRGGVYPDHVRIVVVRDRSLTLMVAETLNNPAYGSGMNPQGRMNRLIWLPQSAALLSQGKLGEEAPAIACKNTHIDEETFLHMRMLSQWQEHKGRLIDAMYRRESALSQMGGSTRAYERAREMLDAQVQRLNKLVSDEPAEQGQRSGYDADIEYLRRKAQHAFGFVPDVQRERCIESGYAMRSRIRSYALTDLTEKSERTAAPKSAKPTRMQAANGQWFEQVSMFE